MNSAGTTLYVADSFNHLIRAVSIPGGVVTTVAGTVVAGVGQSGRTNGAALSSKFLNPQGLCLNSAGTTLFVADTGNNEIRAIDLVGGTVSLFAGSTTGATGLLNGTGTSARFNSPRDIELDPATGNYYIADYTNDQIRLMTPAGVVSLRAGSPTGVPGIADGSGSVATFSGPSGLAAIYAPCASVIVYIADNTNTLIRAMK